MQIPPIAKAFKFRFKCFGYRKQKGQILCTKMLKEA